MIPQSAWTLSDDKNYLVGSTHQASYHLVKRLIDLTLAIIALILLSPLLLLIALGIKLDTPGPILFVQQRVGARRHTKTDTTYWEIITFPCYKFRSMMHNADPALHQTHITAFITGQLEGDHSDHARFKIEDDPRITRVGNFLRKTSLDELPQLLNVIKGNMSLVGPRPVPIYEVDQYQTSHYGRLAALPGVTGFWQIKGRGTSTFEEMIDMDLDYVAQRSLSFDLTLLIATIPAVLTRRGAR